MLFFVSMSTVLSYLFVIESVPFDMFDMDIIQFMNTESRIHKQNVSMNESSMSTTAKSKITSAVLSKATTKKLLQQKELGLNFKQISA